MSEAQYFYHIVKHPIKLFYKGDGIMKRTCSLSSKPLVLLLGLLMLVSVMLLATQTTRAANSDSISSVLAVGNNINITGTLAQAHPGATLNVYELAVYETPTISTEGAGNLTAWNLTAVDLSTRTPVTSVSAGSSFTLSFPLVNQATGATRLYSKFYVALADGGNLTLIDCNDGRFVTNPEALAQNTSAYPVVNTIKGIQVMMPSDAERLGAKHAFLNIELQQLMLSATSTADKIRYDYEGQTYYFNAAYVKDRDETVKNFTDNGMIVYAELVFYYAGKDTPNTPNNILVHPDVNGGFTTALNLTNAEGLRYYKAMISFLAQRYSRADQQYGRIDSWIVGNEVAADGTWFNMGSERRFDACVEQYERQLRLTYDIVTSTWSNARVFVCLDSAWTYVDNPNIRYANKDFMNSLEALTQTRGDFGWNIAFHPYPPDGGCASTWNYPYTHDENDTYISFGNLEVLTNYMSAHLRYNNGTTNVMRHLILSEEGFKCEDYSNSVAMAEQAAAYAYAYYTAASNPAVDAFILYRQWDTAPDYFGIWTTDTSTGVSLPGVQKPIYNVVKNIDRENSLTISQPYLQVIANNMISAGLLAPGSTYTSWNQLVPNFNQSAFEQTLLPNWPTDALAGTATVSDAQLTSLPVSSVSWQPTDLVNNMTTVSYQGKTNVLQVTCPHMMRQKDYYGVTYSSGSLNLSGTPVLVLDVSASTSAGNSTKFLFMVRVYSGDNIIEGTAVGTLDQWNRIAIDLSGWSGLNDINKIKVWYQSYNNELWPANSILDIGGLYATTKAAVTLTSSLSGVNLAKDKLVTASSEFTPSRGAYMLTNGQTGWNAVQGDDFWSSVANPITNQWAYVDLGSPQNFNRIVVYPRIVDNNAFCFPSGFELQASNNPGDPNGWITIYNATNFTPQPDGTGIAFNVGDQNYRYVRFYATQLTTDQYGDHYAQFSELEVYNYSLAKDKPVTASSEFTPSRGAYMLTNGQTGWNAVQGDDFWASVANPITNQWAYVDLGSQQNFSRIVVYPRINDGQAFCFPSGFELQASNNPSDPNSWSTLYTVTSFTPQPDGTGIAFNVGDQNYRYVRFYATQLTTDQYGDHYAQFSELEVNR